MKKKRAAIVKERNEKWEDEREEREERIKEGEERIILEELKKDLIKTHNAEIEKNLGMKAKLNLMPMQEGDVRKSHADVKNLIRDFDYTPKWSIKEGIRAFIQWYVDYYKLSLPTR